MVRLPSGSSADAAPVRRGRQSAVLLVAGDRAAVPDDLADLGDALAAALPAGWSVSTVVRDGPSAIAESVRGIAARGAEELVVIPLHPQFTSTVTGAILRDLYGALRRHGLHLGLTVRSSWHDDAGYVHALARDVARRVEAQGVDPRTTYLRFETSRQEPEDEGETGTYRQHVRCTAELVVDHVGWPADRWLLQSVSSLRSSDAGACPLGADHVLVCTLPFPANGDGDDRVAPGVVPADFADVLRSIVLHGPQPVSGNGHGAAPLLVPAPPSRDEPMRLVMIGASVANGLGLGRGPTIRYSDPHAFRLVKRSRKALRTCLEYAREHTPLAEAFVWNTCQRIEVYGWLPAAIDAAEQAEIGGSLRSALYGAEPAGLEVNVLEGGDAWHHLMRTACGLNSGLPGDRDVTAQLQAAGRLAQCAGTGGPHVAALVDAAVAFARDVHAGTAWGRFSTGYCAAALTRICEVDGARLDRFEHVIIGGSTTSRSILTTLSEEHGVRPRQLTLVYRDHHGQLRQLRAALGSGRRLRVHAYGEEPVLRAMADADFVYFGIDQAEPVLDAAALIGVRDLAARPLTLVDFNQFGSITGADALGPITLWSAKELDVAVAAHAAVTITRSGFAEALADVEERILARLPASVLESSEVAAGLRASP
jgi:glutamyl-tRNA reductase